MEEEDSFAIKAIKKINTDWSENWDLIIDFFGQETADLIDKAIIEIENIEK